MNSDDQVTKTNQDGPSGKQEKYEDKSKEHEEKINPQIEEVMKDVPPQVRKELLAIMRTSSSFGRSSHPLFEKFDSEHIHKFLDYNQKDDDNEFKLKSSNRWFYLLYTLCGLGFLSFLIIYLLPMDKPLLYEVLKIIAIFGGGLGSGFGLKTALDKKR
ncbi:MAG: hypothetical protein HY963_08355 [Ignavibacteriales bacterium]|nr:hypothetical protein [Ignavibacteriales bacterium]